MGESCGSMLLTVQLRLPPLTVKGARQLPPAALLGGTRAGCRAQGEGWH